MNPVVGCVLLATLAAIPLAARPQASDHSVQTDAEAFQARLDTLIGQKKYADAEQILRARIDKHGDPAAAYLEIGKIYFNHDAWQRSAKSLESCLGLNSTNDEAHRLLGLDYRALHRPGDAEVQLLEAVNENPSSRINAYFAGHQLLLNGKFEAALPYLYNAVNSKALESQASQALALAQARLGNYGLAESYYRKAIDSPQTSDDERYASLVDLGVLLLLGHDPENLVEGLNCARRAGKLKPKSEEAHFLAGKALLKLGRPREASPELAQASKLNPQDSKPHFLLAQVYDQLGQPALAEKERKDIARMENHSGEAGMGAVRSALPGQPADQ